MRRTLVVFLTLAGLAGAVAAQPTFDKSFAPSTIGPGSVSTLTFTITNGDLDPASDVAFTDNLPAGMTVAGAPAITSTCFGGTVSASAGSGSISYSGGGVPGSRSCSITVDVTSATPGTHTNVTGELTSSLGNSGTATADLTVDTNRPGFSKSFSPASVFFDGRSTLTFTIDNSASGSLTTNLRFTDNLPPNMVIASPANASTTCTGGVVTAPAGGGTISYTATFVTAGATCTATVDVIGGAVGVLGNTTEEFTSQPGGTFSSSGRASASLTVTVEQLSLTKSFTDDPVPPGETVTLEFTVRNLNRRSSATDITFTDDLEATLTGLEAVGLPLADPCGAGSVLSGTSLLTLSGGNLPVGGSCIFSVTLQVPTGATPGSYVNTTSAISADVDGSPVGGSPGSDVLFVLAAPVLTKEFTDDPVGAGDSVTLEFSITNTSPTDSATDIAFLDELTTFLPFPVSVTLPADDFCGAGSTMTLAFIDTERQGLSLTGGNLAATESCTFQVTIDLPVGLPGGNYLNTTEEITATVGEETVTGDPASDTLIVVAAPALLKEFTDDPAVPGGTVTLQFTLTHDELAAGDATGITFSDDLDAALTGLAATGLPAADVCGAGSQISGTSTLLLTGGSLAPGTSCTFNVTLDVPGDAPVGSHTNTTSAVVATVAGVTATENPASDDLLIAGLSLSKEFIDDPVLPGDTIVLRFTIDNISPISDATSITFTDNLDAALDNLAATVLPSTEDCGAGSSLTGTTSLTFSGGSLAAGESCSFDVTLLVPAGAADGTYSNITSNLTASVEGSPVTFDPATDDLTVASDFLALAKEFTDDPVSPGGTVNLRFTVTNTSDTEAIDTIAFTDDLDAALAELVSTSGSLTDVCGTGSEISGSDLLAFTGGSLAAGTSCSFDVTLSVPSEIEPGTIVTNVTSGVTGTIGGIGVSGSPASDILLLNFLTFSKAFSEESVLPGSTVSLSFTIENLSTTDSVSLIRFSDDLDAMLSGLEAIGLPAFDACGEGSVLSGTSLVTLTDANLLPSASCTFAIDVQVPLTAEAGSYDNVTSDLTRLGLPVAPPATATLLIKELPPCATLSLTASLWALISLPCDPGEANTVGDIFGDDIGGVYNTDWVMYERDEANGEYDLLSLGSPLAIGVGYWIFTKVAAIVDLFGTSNVETDVALEADPGSGVPNMVGHPFDFDVCWADALVIDGESILTLDQADPAGECQLAAPDGTCAMSSVMQKWNGNAYVPFDGSTPGAEGVLEPWDGFWVDAFRAGIALRVPALPSEGCGGEAPERAGGGWYVRLTATSGGLVDDGNVFGQLADSRDGWDAHDLVELAPFGAPYLTVVFPHGDKWGERAGDYSTDFQALGRGPHRGSWPFEVWGSDGVSQVTLTWQGPEHVLRGSTLEDPATGQRIPIRPDGSYTVRLKEGLATLVWHFAGSTRVDAARR